MHDWEPPSSSRCFRGRRMATIMALSITLLKRAKDVTSELKMVELDMIYYITGSKVSKSHTAKKTKAKL